MTEIDQMSNEELDAALADAIGEFVDREGDRATLHVVSDEIVYDGVEIQYPDLGGNHRYRWSPSTNISDFADVEYWIEHQGWRWEAGRNPCSKVARAYYYRVVDLTTQWALGDTKMRAGCIAVLKLLEGKGNDDD